MLKKLLLTTLLILFLASNCWADEIDQQNATVDAAILQLGNSSNVEYRDGNSFILSGTKTVTRVDIYEGTKNGSPTGNIVCRIETDDGGSPSKPSGNLANANATKSLASLTENDWNTFTFDTPFALSAATKYWIVIECDNQTSGNYWKLGWANPGGYASGNLAQKQAGTWADYATLDLSFKVWVQVAGRRRIIIVE